MIFMKEYLEGVLLSPPLFLIKKEDFMEIITFENPILRQKAA